MIRPFFKLAARSILFWFGAIWFAVGTALLMSGLDEMRKERDFARRALPLQGLILSKSFLPASREAGTSTRYQLEYGYSLDGADFRQTREVDVDQWEAAAVGDIRALEVLPQRPDAPRVAGERDSLTGWLFLFLGSVFGGIGGWIFFQQLARIVRDLRLRRSGIPASARVLAVEPSDTTINRVTQWQIRYGYTDHLGVEQEGISRLLSPEEAAQWQEGDPALVHYDRESPSLSTWLGPAPGTQSQPLGPAPPLQSKWASFLKSFWFLIWMLALLFVAALAGEMIRPVLDLDQLAARYQPLLLSLFVPAAALGFVLFMGSALHLLFHSEHPVRGGVVRGGEQFTLAELVAARRDGRLLKETQWRRRLTWTAGALLLGIGIFGIIFSLAPVAMKLLLAGGGLYAAARFLRGVREHLRRAGR